MSMKEMYYDGVIIGGGCAGLAAAAAMKKNGAGEVIVLERDEEAGGILNQCIHNGFGLSTFHEQMSGPAFAQRYMEEALNRGVIIRTGATVTKLYSDRTLVFTSAEDGCVKVKAGAVILAVGCYERNGGAIAIPGTRPAGVYTAGQAQRYLNMDGLMVGKRVFILGSGDIGLIMARRMTLEGAEVLGVAEVMPYSNGLARNIHQCLEDYDIPLYLSTTVTKIYGKKRLTGIDLSKVDEHRNPIPSTTRHIDCDTLLLSVGLIPENHLAEECGVSMDPRTKGPKCDETYMTDIEGIFACGNGLHVHDLADYAAKQGTKAGEAAAAFIREGSKDAKTVNTEAGNGVSYVVPSRVHTSHLPLTFDVYFRFTKPMENIDVIIRTGDKVLRTVHKDKAVPSEMETVTLAGKMLEGTEDELVIEVRGETA